MTTGPDCVSAGPKTYRLGRLTHRHKPAPGSSGGRRARASRGRSLADKVRPPLLEQAGAVVGSFRGSCYRLEGEVLLAGREVADAVALVPEQIQVLSNIVCQPPFLQLAPVARSDRLWPIRMAAYSIGALIVPGLLFFRDAEYNVAGANSDVGRWLFVPSFLIYGVIVGLIGDLLLCRTGDSRSPATAS